MNPYFQAGSSLRDLYSNTLFGPGSDGDVALSSGTTNLARTMYYKSLSLSGTAVLNTNGFRVHVQNLLSLSGTAVIQNNGGNGANGSGTGAGAGGTASVRAAV